MTGEGAPLMLSFARCQEDSDRERQEELESCIEG